MNIFCDLMHQGIRFYLFEGLKIYKNNVATPEE